MHPLSYRCLLILSFCIDTALAEPPAAEPYHLEAPDKVEVPIDIKTPQLRTIAEELHPVSRNLRSEFRGCRSEIHTPMVTFRNIGSMCVDGMFALMEGRGCTKIVGTRDPTGTWVSYACETPPTCDILHNSTFAVLPVGIPIVEHLGDRAQLFCSDNNYRVIRL